MPLSNLDRELLRDCLAGDPEAWRGFCDRFIGLVIHVVYHTTSSFSIRIDDSTRDDLVADVFVTLLERDFMVLRKFRGESSLATYLAVVARRAIARRISQMKLKSVSVPIQDLPHEPDMVDEEPLAKENLEALENSLSKLSSPEATAIRMFHLEGKSYRDIGTHLGMPENSVGPFLTGARAKMRKSI